MPMNLPAYAYSRASDNDPDDQGGPSDQDYDNGPAPMLDQSTMPASMDQTNRFSANQGTQRQLQQWLEENVYSKGWTVDASTNEIVDPEDNYKVIGRVPTMYPMV